MFFFSGGNLCFIKEMSMLFSQSEQTNTKNKHETPGLKEDTSKF